jgi:hypothetical protein
MKKQLLFASLIWSSFCNHDLKAQSGNGAGTYISSISNAQVEMNQKYMAYMSAAAHGRRARKVEKMRQATLSSIDNSKTITIGLPYFNGDNTLRQSSIAYIQLCYNVFNEDYGKIVNLEEIAEQSIDKMEAFILLQEKTSEKIKQAAEKMHQAVKDFATKYQVNLIETSDELGDKMEKADQVNHYVNQIYLLFFKCNFQDGQLVGYLNNNKVNDVEQARSALLKYANDGLASLGSLKTLNGDPQLAMACRRAMEYYKKSATEHIPKMLAFFLKKDSFEKMVKNFESHSSHTKQEVDAYNASIADMNAASNAYNQLNGVTNSGRNQIIQEWESAQKEFLNAHMPYYK